MHCRKDSNEKRKVSREQREQGCNACKVKHRLCVSHTKSAPDFAWLGLTLHAFACQTLHYFARLCTTLLSWVFPSTKLVQILRCKGDFAWGLCSALHDFAQLCTTLHDFACVSDTFQDNYFLHPRKVVLQSIAKHAKSISYGNVQSFYIETIE
jgi:hypothetical protein